MNSFLKRILMSLFSGYILLYYSELLFWARYDPETMALPDFLITYFVYSLAAYILLSTVSVFRVRSIWALFLTGAIYGWIIEGVIVQTVYEDLPLSISWTGLAWHALISVIIGWYYMRKILLENNYYKTIRTSLLIGLFYGFWSLCWWEMEDTVTSFSEFSLYTIFTSAVLILCYWAYNRIDLFLPTKIEMGTVIAIILFFFVFTLMIAPIAVFILPSLLIVVYITLKRNKSTEQKENIINALQGNIKPLNYVLLLFIPLTAMVIYGFSLSLGLFIPTHIIIYTVTTPLGFIMLFLSIIKVFRKNRSPINFNIS